jgi:hypothetical protein
MDMQEQARLRIGCPQGSTLPQRPPLGVTARPVDGPVRAGPEGTGLVVCEPAHASGLNLNRG